MKKTRSARAKTKTKMFRCMGFFLRPLHWLVVHCSFPYGPYLRHASSPRLYHDHVPVHYAYAGSMMTSTTVSFTRAIISSLVARSRNGSRPKLAVMSPLSVMPLR